MSSPFSDNDEHDDKDHDDNESETSVELLPHPLASKKKMMMRPPTRPTRSSPTIELVRIDAPLTETKTKTKTKTKTALGISDTLTNSTRKKSFVHGADRADEKRGGGSIGGGGGVGHESRSEEMADAVVGSVDGGAGGGLSSSRKRHRAIVVFDDDDEGDRAKCIDGGRRTKRDKDDEGDPKTTTTTTTTALPTARARPSSRSLSSSRALKSENFRARATMEADEVRRGLDRRKRHPSPSGDGVVAVGAAKAAGDASLASAGGGGNRGALPLDDDDKDVEPIVPRNVAPFAAPDDNDGDAAFTWSIRRGCLLVRNASPPVEATATATAAQRQLSAKRRRFDTFFATSSTKLSQSSLHRRHCRTKVAAFDLDNTLFLWRVMWPSRLDQYELWSSSVVSKLRSLYDDDNFLLAVLSNQGGIRNAFSGKRAAKAKALVDWLASEVGRPICAVMSTDKAGGYHKPDPKMWEALEEECNGGIRIDVSESFYVGDSAGAGAGGVDGGGGNDGQITAGVDAYQDDGVDRLFAENVSFLRKANLKFQTPDEFFGMSDYAKRRKKEEGAATTKTTTTTTTKTTTTRDDGHAPPPEGAIRLRAALSGGYLRGPILLVLCGAQGSGKSTFCDRLCGKTDRRDGGGGSVVEGRRGWVHLSQDTIRNGKPGKREAVEDAALAALESGQTCVVIDRMHLSRDQRSYFVAVAIEAEVPVHCVVLDAPALLCASRVRQRVDHPGKVQGARCAGMATASVRKLVLPEYGESFDLISRAGSAEGADLLADAYRRVVFPTATNAKREDKFERIEGGGSNEGIGSAMAPVPVPRDFALSCGWDECGKQDMKNDAGVATTATATAPPSPLRLPSIAIGTQKVGKRVAASVVAATLRAGLTAVDTAPTYNNEEEVGRGIRDGLPRGGGLGGGGGCGDKGQKCFVIVKVPKRATSPRHVRDELTSSLQRLGISSADLLLLHWPPSDVAEDGVALASIWSEMERLLADGLCRNLGVSNFTVPALRSLLPMCKNAMPVVNQIERHPLLPQWDVVDYCAFHGIVVQAHTPLGGGREELLGHPTISRVAQRYGGGTVEGNGKCWTAAQILLLWNLGHGVAVVVKAADEHHLKEVAEVNRAEVGLMPEDMEELDGIGQSSRSDLIRFVAPPFMNKPGSLYSFGDRPPSAKKR